MEFLEEALNLLHLQHQFTHRHHRHHRPMTPLDLIKRYDVIRSISEFHIKKDATYVTPPSIDIKDIYNKLEEPTWDTSNLSLEDIILRYFRDCPLRRSDTKVGYIVLNEKEYQHLWDNDAIKLTNGDIPMTHGYPNLYQHIHIHQQATDAINFKITSSILLGSNDKIDVNWKRDYFAQKLYLVAIAIAGGGTSNKEHLTTIPSRQQSTSRVRAQPADIYTTTSCTTDRQCPCDTSWTNHPSTSTTRSTILASCHLTSLTRQPSPDLLTLTHTSLISLCAHDTIRSKAHRHIQMYFPHMMNIIKWQEEATSTSRTMGRTSATSSTSTLTTNIRHSKGATTTIKYNDDNVMEID